MSIDTMRNLLVHQLQELHSAELQIVRAWPALAKQSTARSLRLALMFHHDDSLRHATRLERALELLDAAPTSLPCTAMDRMITQAMGNAESDAEPALRDALILGDCQRVEGYEIAAYSTARIFADALGHGEIVELLERTLTEEEVADAILTEIERREVRPARQRVTRSAGARVMSPLVSAGFDVRVEARA